MLNTLIIKDFAIIDRLEISLAGGMTVLTGETGAGKSIIINALNLLLGGRASTDVIRSSSDQAIVEGSIRLTGNHGDAVAERLVELGIECDDRELVVRRIVSRTGRNKVLLNGSLATVSTLRELMRGAIDISGQHEHYSLLDASRHVRLLDRFGKLDSESQNVARQYAELQALRAERDELRDAARDRLARIDYLRFQLKELENAELTPGEEEALADELSTLENAEWLREVTAKAESALYEADGSVVEALDQFIREFNRAAQHSSRLETLANRLSEARALIDDVVHELRSFQEIEDDPGRLDAVQRRLATLEKLQRKYGRETEELIEDIVTMRDELERLEGAESRIEGLDAEVEKAEAELLERARSLSKKRQASARKLEGQVERELANLGMPHCEFKVSVEPNPEPEGLRSHGIDTVEFLMSPNPGEPCRPLARIASGGELSRVMLAIKQVFATSDEVNSYVFDEVDTGIGGAVADKVGRALRAVSAEHQVLCITHLATIASYADHHFAISKRTAGERTVSEIRQLSEDERIREIARMLGGMSITERSLEHAAEMVQRARVPAE